jgi:predicted CxxxxCH...CXXCH cytochrome family protein
MAGVYVVNLIVNDGFTNSAPVSVTITAANANSTPVANGGLDLTANTGDTVQLNGSASYDPDNDPLTYTWTLTAQPTGSSATLIDANTVAPSFVADVTGSYVISLVVNDNTLNSVPDSVMVTVTSPPSNCTLCHGQPPDGTIFPNTQGTHPIHTSLPNVQNDCNICHSTAAHNSVVDVTFAATYNAKSGTASLNSATGTCSNVSCHGGQTTPAWANGTLDVNTQCSSCHQSGNTQHNSFNSGFHSFHVNTMRYACTVCHDTSKLATNHFSNLDTPLFEGPASATIGGGTTRVTSYVASSRQCAAMCHGTRAW